jgi:hypothetical protein
VQTEQGPQLHSKQMLQVRQTKQVRQTVHTRQVLHSEHGPHVHSAQSSAVLAPLVNLSDSPLTAV